MKRLRNPEIARLHRQAMRSHSRKRSSDARIRTEALAKVRRVLRQSLAKIAKRAKAAHEAVTRTCKAARRRVLERTRREREDARLAMNASRDAGFERVRLECQTKRQRVDRARSSAEASVRLRADHERRLVNEVYGGRRATTTAREQRQESDEAVERNIAPELVPIWRKHRRHIKGDARRSRLEAFEEWIHDNEAEVRAELASLLEKESQRAERTYLREQEKWEREQHEKAIEALARKFISKGLSKAAARRAAKAELLGLSDVPF